jgi:hypothetical protein
MGIYAPSPVDIGTGRDEIPRAVGTVEVDTVREEWLIEDRWWTSTPLRRRYFELALADGRCVVVFCELGSGRWFCQRA